MAAIYNCTMSLFYTLNPIHEDGGLCHWKPVLSHYEVTTEPVCKSQILFYTKERKIHMQELNIRMLNYQSEMKQN